MQHSDLKQFIKGHRPLAQRGEYFIFPSNFNRQELEQLFGLKDHGIRFSFTMETDGQLSAERTQKLQSFVDGDKLFWSLPHDERDADLVTWHEVDASTPTEVLEHLAGFYGNVFRHFTYKTEVVETVIGTHELNCGGKLIIRHNKARNVVTFDVTTATVINGRGNAEISFTPNAFEDLLNRMK